ncbi:hypothetical protein MTR67_000510 [Solanum verrucosum]|uniref:Disease resistance R13L4/SHOC-2-like LRR domain-containing protein n=1 Tax=Solanum verrucosum TaxID=315347 RepID=A0AAF0PQ57_SOLVR|nr:hypothetical protein MTR67_000510 [Solanum verrucosum]
MTGQVTELNLGDSQLQGKFHDSNSSLFQLSSLKRLDLSNNNFSGSLIPPKFGELSSLTHLDLSNSGLSGLIPVEISHLSKLQELDLYNVNATGRIPESFGHLTSLRTLTIASCNLSGSIPKPLWNLTNIYHLDLGYNHLEGSISNFFRFGKLTELYLGNNNFDGQLEFLSFNGWGQLEQLDFSFNSLTGPIPSNLSVFSLPSLTNLGLSDNHLSGKIQEFESGTLSEVDLKQNQLQGPIPKSLLDQMSLQHLLLSYNNLSGKIASTICNVNMLQVLDLGSNNLEGAIPQCLGEISGLVILDLSNNSLSGTINTNFSIGNQLKVIKLHGNKLEGKIPRSLINCTYLEVLDLGNNELNDTFPKWLGTLLNLKILSLRSNMLHGPLKVSKNQNLFDRLQIIDASSNGFSGSLPASLFENFQAMRIIDQNVTTPGYLGDIELIYESHVSELTTKGRDLESVRVFPKNIFIDLSNNRFEGQIPSIIGDLIGLRTLNLSHNVLEGHIPVSLQNLSVLESLDLSSNKIGGGIPQQLASLTFLAVLNLSHNHLVGCIPKGKQFDTFENSSYQGNDGLRGLPFSNDCGGSGGDATTPFGLDQEEEEEEGDSAIISWKAVLMGYGCGLVIGLSIIYIMLSTQYPAWFSRMDVKLEHIIITRMKKHKKRY